MNFLYELLMSLRMLNQKLCLAECSESLNILQKLCLQNCVTIFFRDLSHLLPDTSNTWRLLQLPISDGRRDNQFSLNERTLNLVQLPICKVHHTVKPSNSTSTCEPVKLILLINSYYRVVIKSRGPGIFPGY